VQENAQASKEVVMPEQEDRISTVEMMQNVVQEKTQGGFAEIKNEINYDTFTLVDLRVGQIIAAERVPKSKKLIKMSVDIGTETRVILSGIGTTYTPEELVDRKVVVIVNLAPRTMMGIASHGMILAASDNHASPYLIKPPDDTQPGFIVM
jgi:methionyl-tRNA synthetase